MADDPQRSSREPPNEPRPPLHPSHEAALELVEMIPAGFFIYRFQDPDRLHLLYGNPEAETLTGLKMEEWIGREFNEIWPNAREAGITGSYLRVMTTGEPFLSDEVVYEDERVAGAFRIHAFRLSDHRLAVSFENITEKKRAEKELEASEARFRHLFETMTQGVVYLGREGRISRANEAAEKILGLTADQIVGRTPLDPRWRAMHEDGSEFPGETHPLSVALATGEAVMNRVMGVYNPSDDDYRWLRVNAVPMARGEEDRPFEVYAVFEDITARKKTEWALKESEERLRAFFEYSNVGLAMAEPREPFRYIAVNETLAEWNGCPAEAHPGRSPADVLPPEIAEMLGGVFRKVRDSGEPATVSPSDFEAAGAPLFPRAEYFPIRNTEGEVAAIGAVVLDLTRSVEAERALKESEAKTRAVLEAVPDMIFRCAADGTYLDFWEGRGVDPLVAPEEFLGKTVAEIMPPGLTERTLESFREALETNQAQVMEFELPGPSKPGFFEAHIAPFQSGEILSVVRDVTERVQAQRALEETNKQLRQLTNQLQSVREEERQAVARELHDELGQTLAGLLIDLDWLGQRLPEEAPDEGEVGLADRLLGLIQLAERANDMVHDLSARLRPPLLDELGLEAALEWHVKSYFRRADLDYELILPREPLELDSETAITAFRIVQESITNVVRHAGATAAGVRVAREGEQLILEVWDDGLGVDEVALERRKGLGLLGLRERTAGLGGSVEVNRREEGGTLVRAAIPLEREKGEEERHP